MVFRIKPGYYLTPTTVEDPGLLDINLELETEKGPAVLPNLIEKEARYKSDSAEELVDSRERA